MFENRKCLKERNREKKMGLFYLNLATVIIFLFIITASLGNCETAQKKNNPMNQVNQNHQKDQKNPSTDFSAPQKDKKDEKISLSLEVELEHLFEDNKDKNKFFQRFLHEKKGFGKPINIWFSKTKKIGKYVVEQRSGRKRLYDHNILLRAIFEGKIIHKQFADLAKLFKDAVFIDIGSAILFEEGAPTVRDIYEDKELTNFLHRIVATDINDYSKPITQYINIYRQKKEKLPFAVEEIDMSITRQQQIKILISPFVKDDKTPLIFRAASSGPDLYYMEDQLKYHLKAIIEGCQGRNVIYLFNSLILFKHESKNQFQLLGNIDENVGLAHRHMPWTKIKWEKRKLSEAFKENAKYLKIEK
jgi:hypothetical protein